MLSAMQAPSTRRHMNAATTPKLRNTMAAVSCRERAVRKMIAMFLKASLVPVLQLDRSAELGHRILQFRCL